MKNYKGFVGVGVLLAVSAIFYSPSPGNKDAPVNQAQLHSIKFTTQFGYAPSTSIVQLAEASAAVSFDRPGTPSTRVILAPLQKSRHYGFVVVRNNGPPAA